MSLITKIVIGIIVLHLIAGFGWLMYVLAPRKKEETKGEG